MFPWYRKEREKVEQKNCFLYGKREGHLKKILESLLTAASRLPSTVSGWEVRITIELVNGSELLSKSFESEDRLRKVPRIRKTLKVVEITSCFKQIINKITLVLSVLNFQLSIKAKITSAWIVLQHQAQGQLLQKVH